MTLIEKIAENTRKQIPEENCALALSLELDQTKAEITRELQRLAKEGQLARIQGKPVLYVDRSVLGALYSGSVPKEFESLEQYCHWRKSFDRKSFDKLIGATGSLALAVENTKSAITYPPRGLTMIYTGETGTGKSLMARLAFEYGQEIGRFKPDARFIQVNCSEFANNPELLTASLFGYKKGAFTGADADNPGFLNAANDGILFLDEVQSLQPECQEKLFLYLDSGNYRMLGDNKTILHSNAMLIFATTEVPEKVLLKTLMRRIPVRIKLPSLEEREFRDKMELIISALERESQTIGRELQITSSAWNALITYCYPANVGDLNNSIQIACMNALFRNRDEGPVQIHTLMLPENILTSSAASRFAARPGELMTMSELRDKVRRSGERISILKKVIRLCTSDEELPEKLASSRELLQEFTRAQWSKYYNHSLVNQNFLEELLEIVSHVLMKYGYSCTATMKEELAYLLFYGLVSPAEIESKVIASATEDEAFCQFVAEYLEREDSIAQEVVGEAARRLDQHPSKIIQALFALQFSQLSQIDDNRSRAALIICHGQSTATSMADAVNSLLGEPVFDGIDMPLNVSTQKIIDSVNLYLMRRQVYRDLVLLVDMGSLEQIYEAVRVNSTASLAVANHVNTQFALSVGSRLKGGEGLRDIFNECAHYMNSSVKILDRSVRQYAILCSCSTGIGTAEKLQQILEESLPEDSQIAILSYDYISLLQTGLEDSFFDRYEVLAIAGTLDPKVEGVPFIPLEQLISQEALPVLKRVLSGLLSYDQLEEMSRRIVRNFSLNNVIGNLTILNPNKLIDYVERAVNNLSRGWNGPFPSNVRLGLYIHISCLIERLVTRQDINDFEMSADDAEYEQKEFYRRLRAAFAEIEQFYHVEIPFEESEYIRLYLETLLEE